MDVALSWCVVAVTLGWLVVRAPRARASVAAIACVACAVLAAAQLVWRERAARAAGPRAELAKLLPRPTRAKGYVSSEACRACHPSEHASWHRTYHRTMTQAASPASVLGRFDGTTLSSDGHTYRLEQRSDGFWADVEGGPSKRIAMLTGSHHMQAYWTEDSGGSRLVEFPFTWLIDEARWVERRDTFLLSPDHTKGASVWNGSCIECHATAGQPRLEPDPENPDTRVAELGIACEACHGPGRAHVEANSDPFHRASLRRADRGDPTITNPARLAAPVSTQVCGQCHGIGCNLEGWKAHGLDYLPGEDLEQKKPLIVTSKVDSSPCKWFIDAKDDFLESRFWADGSVRVTGREYNQLAGSACFRGGELGCLSCHSMHDSDPDDQIARGKESDGACASCHAAYFAKLSDHTHHASASEGSRCMNCHMPHTTYGLLGAIRSHRIDSPRAIVALATGRPTACTLCHLDKTLAWTAETLEAWYGQGVPELDDDHERIAESVRVLLTGDADQRALVVWSMGWAPARIASGDDWIAPHVIDRLTDRYSAVRAVAGRALRRLPGFEDFAYDYVGAPAARADAAMRALAAWRNTRPKDALARPDLLLGAGGDLEELEWDRLAAQRDDPDMFLAE